MCPPGQLPGGLGIKRFEPASPPLVAVPHVPHPVAAMAALDRRIKAFARRPAQRATAAPTARHNAGGQRPPSPSGPLSCCCVHVAVLDPGVRLDQHPSPRHPKTRGLRERTHYTPVRSPARSAAKPGNVSPCHDTERFSPRKSLESHLVPRPCYPGRGPVPPRCCHGAASVRCRCGSHGQRSTWEPHRGRPIPAPAQPHQDAGNGLDSDPLLQTSPKSCGGVGGDRLGLGHIQGCLFLPGLDLLPPSCL